MKPVLQQKRDDCLCAALASILEVPLPLVPNYSHGNDGDRQHMMTRRWLKRLGYDFLDVTLPRGRTLPFAPLESYAVATVRPRGSKTLHAVVVRITPEGMTWEHDPAGRQRDEYGRVLSVGFLVPTDPRAKV